MIEHECAGLSLLTTTQSMHSGRSALWNTGDTLL